MQDYLDAFLNKSKSEINEKQNAKFKLRDTRLRLKEKFPELEQIKHDDPEFFKRLVDTIDRGFLYLEEEGYFKKDGLVEEGYFEEGRFVAKAEEPFRKVATEYRKIRNKVEKHIAKYLKKQNTKLAKLEKVGPFIEEFDYVPPLPIRVTIEPHPFDDPNPPKKHRPPYFQSALIKELSDLLKVHFPGVPERSELIKNIFKSFFSIHVDPRSVRKHL